MRYITYSEFKSLGGELDETLFPSLERLARVKLDYWTLNRISKLSEISDDIRLCMKLIIEHIKEVEDKEMDRERAITSFSNDGVTVNYANSVIKTTSEKENDLYQQIVEILPVELISICLN